MDIEDTRGIDSLGICIVLAFAQRRADGCREEEGSTRRERGHGGIVDNKATLTEICGDLGPPPMRTKMIC